MPHPATVELDPNRSLREKEFDDMCSDEDILKDDEYDADPKDFQNLGTFSLASENITLPDGTNQSILQGFDPKLAKYYRKKMAEFRKLEEKMLADNTIQWEKNGKKGSPLKMDMSSPAAQDYLRAIAKENLRSDLVRSGWNKTLNNWNFEHNIRELCHKSAIQHILTQPKLNQSPDMAHQLSPKLQNISSRLDKVMETEDMEKMLERKRSNLALLLGEKDEASFSEGAQMTEMRKELSKLSTKELEKLYVARGLHIDEGGNFIGEDSSEGEVREKIAEDGSIEAQFETPSKEPSTYENSSEPPDITVKRLLEDILAPNYNKPDNSKRPLWMTDPNAMPSGGPFLRHWDKDRICEWAKSEGLPKSIQALLKENGITGRILIRYTDKMMKEDGFKRGERDTLMRHINDLKIKEARREGPKAIETCPALFVTYKTE
mmetsp:Transcript_24122/g.37979  ORF Transcript_24122/g.37979 Transcript_24122/m.37979 type:complete len:433 (-) Transcript_24122:36-1334(-)